VTAAVASASGPRTLTLRRIDLSRAATDPRVARDIAALTRRGAVPDRSIRDSVRRTLDDVRIRGSDAVREANARFGGGLADGRLTLDRAELTRARDRLTPQVRRALDQAIANVRRFAETQRPSTTSTEISPGITIERRWQPLDRVGCYVPGGSAAYPSSLVMTTVPAQVAGVGAIVIASPADRDHRLNDVLLGAAGMLEVDAFVVAGGAQAVGALAFGLPQDAVARVDRIVGPGNPWVTAAKLELADEVGIDLPAGPSEGMVLADDSADPVIVAADLITQAEHGPDSPAILVTTSSGLADAAEGEIESQLATAPRRTILRQALDTRGAIVVAPDLSVAVAFVNAYAPEHLSIHVAPLEETVAQIRNTGSVFVGTWAPESAGDYATGANHVLPTGGLARSSGALAVETFGKYIQVQRLTRDGLETIRQSIGTLAAAEGLDAHRQAVERRFQVSDATGEPGRKGTR
jgi:histidinol dehydrogenase